MNLQPHRGVYARRAIKDKYKNHLIILDNANFHKSKLVKDTIDKSKNKIIYSSAYNPQCNPIENFFSQLKNHVKNKSQFQVKLEINK